MTAPRLLVIDDSLTIRKLVELSFRSTPFALEFATSGSEGAAKAVQSSPDVILLDCVLPDMPATDVCRQLARDERSARAPIILMSAKDRNVVRERFRDLRGIVDFVGKPFTSEEILGRVNAALGGSTAGTLAPEAKPRPQPSSEKLRQIEAAAKALYARLGASLAQVPEWLRQSEATGGTAASLLLARKLLTPETVAGVLEGLLPIIRQMPGGEAAPATEEATAESAPLAGNIDGWPLQDLLAIIGASGRTGELVLLHGAQRVVSYWQSGEIVLGTSHDPEDYCQQAPVDLGGVSREARERAAEEQRASGKPFYVTLAEAGHLSEGIDLTALLHERGVRLLRAAADARGVRFSWRDRATLPAYAECWGRHLSPAHDLPPSGGGEADLPDVAQLSLERLRRPSAWSEVDARLPGPDQSYERAYAFSSKLRRLRLCATEQRVLTLVDRRHSLRTIVERAGLPEREVARILHRLSEVDLIQPVLVSQSSVVSSSSVRTEPVPRPVMVLDPDREEFCKPLAELLSRRPRPVPVLEIAGEADLMDAVIRQRPSLVVLNEQATAGGLESLARNLRASPQLANTALAAVLAQPALARADALVAAGFDAVWAKPVHYLDVVALLGTDPFFTPTPNHVPPAQEKEIHAIHSDRR